MRSRSLWVCALGVGLAVSVVACGGGSKESSTSTESAAPAGGGQKVDPATAGDINGVVSFDVKVGDKVTRGQIIGRSGMTGMAGGDHLHFTMLVNGRMVNPVEWWDPHWIQDRVLRKLGETSGTATTAAAGR